MIEVKKNNSKKNNKVKVNGVTIGKVSDSVAMKIISLVENGDLPQETPVVSASAPVQTAPKIDFSKTVKVGEKLFSDGNCTVTVADKGDYRLYIDSPVKKVRYGIKSAAKELGAEFGGDFSKGDLWWYFPTKKSAQDFIKGQKARMK